MNKLHQVNNNENNTLAKKTMTKRRARFRRHATDKTMVKLKGAERGDSVKDYYSRMSSSRLGARHHLAAALIILSALVIEISHQTTNQARPLQLSARQLRKMNNANSFHDGPSSSLSASSSDDADPMEPCYLAQNRASETLTISESTPVGTIVGELMVSSAPLTPQHIHSRGTLRVVNFCVRRVLCALVVVSPSHTGRHSCEWPRVVPM